MIKTLGDVLRTAAQSRPLVMDGDLDGFIFAYLKAASRGELKED